MPTPDHLGVKGQAKVQPPPQGLGRALLWPLGVLGLRMRLGQSWVLGVKRGLKSHIACYFYPLPTPRFVSPKLLLRALDHSACLPDLSTWGMGSSAPLD